MKFIFDMVYSEADLEFLSRHNCEIISEIKLPKTDLSEYEIPRRMFKYGSEYIGEIPDEESDQFVWAVLSKWRGVYRFSAYYEDLDVLEQYLQCSVYHLIFLRPVPLSAIAVKYLPFTGGISRQEIKKETNFCLRPACSRPVSFRKSSHIFRLGKA